MTLISCDLIFVLLLGFCNEIFFCSLWTMYWVLLKRPCYYEFNLVHPLLSTFVIYALCFCSFDLIFSAFPVLHLFFTLHQLASTTASHGHCGFGRFGLCTYSTIGRRGRRVRGIGSSTCCCFFLSKTCMAHQFCCLGSLCNLLCCASLVVVSLFLLCLSSCMVQTDTTKMCRVGCPSN